jgi:hypothetical protein
MGGFGDTVDAATLALYRKIGEKMRSSGISADHDIFGCIQDRGH